MQGAQAAGTQPAGTQPFPLLQDVALDTTDARALAEFYRKLLGFCYRPGDEPPAAGQPDEKANDWLVLWDQSGSPRLAFQQVEALRRSTWPDGEVPQQLHLDLRVRTVADLEIQYRRAVELGATVLLDRSQDEDEPLWVFADPDGHPFCIYVGAS